MSQRKYAHRKNLESEIVKMREEGMCKRETDKTYGYRRVWKWLKDTNIRKNPKTVLRIMKKYGLLSEIRRRRKWVNQNKTGVAPLTLRHSA